MNPVAHGFAVVLTLARCDVERTIASGGHDERKQDPSCRIHTRVRRLAKAAQNDSSEYKISYRLQHTAEEKLKMTPLRILIADEQDLVRRGLKLLVESHPGWGTISAEARTGREAVSAAKKLKPDIAILALSMPELNCLEATKRIRKTLPNTEILILSTDHSEQLVREILGVGNNMKLVE